jgi:hypothetical protein
VQNRLVRRDDTARRQGDFAHAVGFPDSLVPLSDLRSRRPPRQWGELTEVQREFFRSCVREMLLERELVLAALG